jgi:hypothetical protein
MATKIYNNGSKVVFEDTSSLRDYDVKGLNYAILDGTVTFTVNGQVKENTTTSDVQNKTGGTFASDLLLSEYLSSFINENSSILVSTSNQYGILGQSSPSATTLTTLYTVPSGKMIDKGVIFVCNRANTAGTFRIALRKAGASISNQHYIYYDVSIKGNDTYHSYEIKLDETDVVIIYSSTANMSFNINGELINK